MKTKRVLSLILSMLMLLGLLAGCGESGNSESGSDSAASFSIGYGQVDISPSGSVPLTGFGDTDERSSTHVSERLYATAIAMRDAEGDTVVVVAYDLINAKENWSTPLREELAKQTGLPMSNIMLHCSHTHSGPAIATMPTYQAEVKIKTIEAVKAAIADISPATVSGNYTRVEEKLNCVRHYLMNDGTYMAEGVGAYKSNVIGHTDMPDNLLQAIRFTREGKKDIVMMNWQAHYLGSKLDYNAVTSDYQGVARTTVEQALDCHSIFITGASGNLNSWSQLDGEMEFEYHTDLGKFLGEKVIELNNNLKPLNADNLQIKEVMRSTPTKANPNTKEDIPLYALSFGDVGMFFAPYEMFDSSAVDVRERSPFTMTFCASCSNAARSYIPTPQSWDWDAQYEVRVTRYEKGTAEKLADEFVNMLTELSNNSGHTPAAKGEGYLTPEFVPTTDGVTYFNPTPGDLASLEAVNNGFYRLYLLKGNTLKTMLAKDQATAEAVMQKESMQLLFDEQYVIVGVVE